MKTVDQLPENNTAQPVVFPGFMVVTAECGNCGADIVGVAPVGTEGITCPICKSTDSGFVWITDKRSSLKHDGAWLTGMIDFTERTMFDEIDADIDEFWQEDDDDGIERIALPLWLVRVIAFVVALRNLIQAWRNDGR